jgi:hypothetical protein
LAAAGKRDEDAIGIGERRDGQRWRRLLVQASRRPSSSACARRGGSGGFQVGKKIVPNPDLPP